MKRVSKRIALAALVAASSTIVAAQSSATSGGYKLATRWAKSFPFSTRVRMGLRPGGGVYVAHGRDLMTDSNLVGFDKAGNVTWTALPGAYQTLRCDSLGNVYVGGFRRISNLEAEMDLYKFGPDGALLAHSAEPTDLRVPYQNAVVNEVYVDELDRPYVATALDFDQTETYWGLHPDLALRFTRSGWNDAGYHSFTADRFGNTYCNPSMEIVKIRPDGTVAWRQQNVYRGVLDLIRFDNGVILTQGWDNEPYSRKINPNGSFIGSFITTGSFIKVNEQTAYAGGFLQTTLTKCDNQGNQVWHREVVDGPIYNLDALGQDKWGYLYAYAEYHDSGWPCVLVKCDREGKPVWKRAMPFYDYKKPARTTIMISPVNGDIYYCDIGESSARLYCLSQAPMSKPDEYVMSKDDVLTVDVSLNDEYGVDADYTIVQGPTGGTASMSPAGVLTYKPVAGFTGVVNLKYSASKPGLLSSGPTNVQIVVGP